MFFLKAIFRILIYANEGYLGDIRSYA